MDPLTIAVPKGRILEAISPLLARAGVDVAQLFADDRRLVRETADGTMRFLFLKPDDVPTYVEHGAADVGFAGRDTLVEKRNDVYAPVDLGIGKCRLVVAGPEGIEPPGAPRVATKYPRTAAEHFARLGIPAEIIPVGGSVELAPLVGLSHLIVDVVETGSTLKQNRLVIRETIAEISTVLIANRAAYKLRADVIRPLCVRLRAAASQ